MSVMEKIYKVYTKDQLEKTMKEQQGADFLNFINEMLKDGWSLSKIDKAKIMTKKAIRERMKKMGAVYDPSICQYVIHDEFPIQSGYNTDTSNVSQSITIESENDTNCYTLDIQQQDNQATKGDQLPSKNEISLSADNVDLLQGLESAMKELTKQMVQLNQNGVKIKGSVGSVPPLPATGSMPGDFVARKFEKDDHLINRNHRFYNSVLERLNAFHEDHPQYNLQQTINSLLSEVLEKHGY